MESSLKFETQNQKVPHPKVGVEKGSMKGPLSRRGRILPWEKRGQGVGTVFLFLWESWERGEANKKAAELGAKWVEGDQGSFHPHPFCHLWEEKHELRDPWGTTGLPTCPAVHLGWEATTSYLLPSPCLLPPFLLFL